MNTCQRLASIAVLAGAAMAVANAQSVLPAHSGTLHYFDGKVTIDGVAVGEKVGKFSEIKENAVLRTEEGRAEVLLTPGVFLRLGEHSAIKMLDRRLVSTRIEFLEGTAMLEADGGKIDTKDPAVTIVYKDYEFQPVKNGLFEITGDPAQLKVYKGQGNVFFGDNHTAVKDGRMVAFSETLTAEKFDDKVADDLYLWTRDRSAYLSAANMSSAGLLARSGYNGASMGGLYPGVSLYSGFGGGWYYNRFLSLYTYMPFTNLSWSPFGYGYFSPFEIYNYYLPGNYFWYGGGAARGVALSRTGSSAVAAAQVNRFGGGMGVHPTLGSPVRSASAGAAPTNGAGYRGGFGGIDRGGFGASRGGFGPGFGGGAPMGGMSAGGGGMVGGGGGGVPMSSGAASGAMAGRTGGGIRGR